MIRRHLGHAGRALLVAAGLLCVALGVLGIVLPGLPTTPFLLLAGFCFARSSERFHQWLLSHRWLGRYIRNFEEGRGMAPRDKVITIGTLWLTMGITIVFFVPVLWAKLAMAAIGLGTTTYLLRLPTAPADDRATRRSP